MSAYAFLMNHDDSTPRTAEEMEEACLLGANYQLPILWLAMFDEDDLTTVQVAGTVDGVEVIDKIPTLFATTQKAKATYARKLPAIARALGDACTSYIAEFDEFLNSKLVAPTVQLDVVDLWGTSEDFEEEIRVLLLGTTTPGSAHWETLSMQACLEDPEVRSFGVRGFPQAAELPWAE